MRKYKVTKEERDVIKKYQNYSIPFTFKAGKFLGYMQYFEYIDFEICYILLKGKAISEKNYDFIFHNMPDEQEIEKQLDDYAKEFYNCYLEIKRIVKKYYMLN
ncbi:MAG: hypothetical protein IKA74_02605 [Clostridia bacterium]|nr:hypothetical protein [Clostridia bacterium]